MRRCKRCLLPETKPNISFDEKRICNYCRETKSNKHFSNNETAARFKKKEEFRKEFEKYIKKIRGKNQYDCLLLFSGGKDSTYFTKNFN